MGRASGVLERARSLLHRARAGSGALDHALRMVERYTAVDGNAQAAAVTYFGFLSFFPLMALAFFVVGKVATVYPDAHQDLITVIDHFLPGLVGNGAGQVPLSVFTQNATTVGLLGALGLVYAGTGWMSGIRTALARTFGVPRDQRAGWLEGKLRDLGTLVLAGLALTVSVAVSGLVSSASQRVLDALGLGAGPTRVTVSVLGHALGLAATTVLFLLLYGLRAPAHLTRRALLEGALLGGLAFEVLKELAYVVIGYLEGKPAFQAFGISLVLVIWISYFSRIMLLGAAWAQTSSAGPGDR